MSNNNLFECGSVVLIRTVTFFQLGKVKEINNGFILLEQASWIPDTGRFSTCLSTGELKEVEVVPDGNIMVNLSAIVDAFRWNHPLPTISK